MPNNTNYISSHSGPAIDAAVSFVNAMPAPDSSNNGKILVVADSAYEAQDFAYCFEKSIGVISLTGYAPPGNTSVSIYTTDSIPKAFMKAQGQINTINNVTISNINSTIATLSSTIESVGIPYQTRLDLFNLLANIVHEGDFSASTQSLLDVLEVDLGLDREGRV